MTTQFINAMQAEAASELAARQAAAQARDSFTVSATAFNVNGERGCGEMTVIFDQARLLPLAQSVLRDGCNLRVVIVEPSKTNGVADDAGETVETQERDIGVHISLPSWTFVDNMEDELDDNERLNERVDMLNDIVIDDNKRISALEQQHDSLSENVDALRKRVQTDGVSLILRAHKECLDAVANDVKNASARTDGLVRRNDDFMAVLATHRDQLRTLDERIDKHERAFNSEINRLDSVVMRTRSRHHELMTRVERLESCSVRARLSAFADNHPHLAGLTFSAICVGLAVLAGWWLQ